MGKRIGIVGTGFIAMKHLAAFKAQKKAEIEALRAASDDMVLMIAELIGGKNE